MRYKKLSAVKVATMEGHDMPVAIFPKNYNILSSFRKVGWHDPDTPLSTSLILALYKYSQRVQLIFCLILVINKTRLFYDVLSLFQTIPPDQELLVYYGNTYEMFLGIPIGLASTEQKIKTSGKSFLIIANELYKRRTHHVFILCKIPVRGLCFLSGWVVLTSTTLLERHETH